jgi:drug/metabolite transporter (DMT)-like permease
MKVSESVQADVALVAITLIWGSTFTIVKQSLAYVSPILFVAMRFWLATVLTLPFMAGQARSISAKSLARGMVLSAVLMGGFLFQTLGLRSTSPSHSAFITSLSVLLVPLLGFLIYRQRPAPQIIAGVLLATAGLFLLLVNMADLEIRSGDMLSLIFALFFALQILFLGRFISKTDYRQLQLMQMAGAAIWCSILVPFLEAPFVVWNSKLVAYLFITGILATAFAFYVQARAQRLTTPNRAALIFSLEPFFASLFAYWVLDQMLSVREWLGGAMVLTGILVSELQFNRRQAGGARCE